MKLQHQKLHSALWELKNPKVPSSVIEDRRDPLEHFSEGAAGSNVHYSSRDFSPNLKQDLSSLSGFLDNYAQYLASK